MSRSIILSGTLDGDPIKVKVVNQDFFPKSGDVVQVLYEPFDDYLTPNTPLEVHIQRVNKNGDYIMVSL